MFVEQLLQFKLLTFQRNYQVVPYGIGKRICLGESLANNELFIFFVMLLQRLTFQPPIGHPPPNPLHCSAGITNIPKPFHVSVTERK